MKWLQKIVILMLGIIFMLSSAGILLYHSHCSCTNSDNVSLYVSPETCTDDFHVHHKHNDNGKEVPSEADNCHECNDHKEDCGCDNIAINFLKLDHEIVQEKNRIDTREPVKMVKPEIMVFIPAHILKDQPSFKSNYADPILQNTSLDFLIQIQQLKISCQA